MDAKRVAVACAALFVVWLGGRSESAPASPVNLTVDSSASYLGTSLIGVPLSGSVVGDFNGTSLTFSGGSNISTSLAFNISGTLPAQTIFNIFPITLSVLSGSYAGSLAPLQLDLTSGAVSNGSNASVPTWARTGGVGSVSGSLDLELTVGPITTTPSIAFSASLTPLASFNSLALFGPIDLSDVGGVTLTLPFGLPITLGAFDLDAPALGAIFETVANSLLGFLDDFIDIGSIPIPGQVVASNVTGTAVPEPATLALLAFGLAGLGVVRRRKNS